MRKLLLAPLVMVCLAAVGCVPSPKSGKGFTLPEGDVERGLATYLSLQCNACHSLPDVEPSTTEAQPGEMLVALGGEVPRIQTYGELVTAIINPSHRLASGYRTDAISVDGESKMKNYNEVMTIAQLADLVTFLQSKYTLEPYEPSPYPPYY
ncbi:MAG: hypothetical protein KDA45_10770 [Planctomycetales bacterium]|nr:hypothetical protein [Planctomycetales bacterium]